MNKQDFILISILTLIIITIFTCFNLFGNNNSSSNALVYYEDKLVLTIDLTKEEQTYEVKGYNGPVYISAGNGKIKVEDEDSPLHLCSKQGYITKSYETIVCLPNKIVVKIENESDIDTIIN